MIYYTGDIHGSTLEIVTFCMSFNLTKDDTIGINGFSSLFVNITDTVTLLAFLIALFVDYMENILSARSEEYINEIKGGQQELLECQNKAESI